MDVKSDNVEVILAKIKETEKSLKIMRTKVMVLIIAKIIVTLCLLGVISGFILPESKATEWVIPAGFIISGLAILGSKIFWNNYGKQGVRSNKISGKL